MRERGCRSSELPGGPAEPILLEVPAAFKSSVVVLQRLFALAASACAHGASDEPMPFVEVERALAVGVGELLRTLHEPLLASMACEEPRLWIGGVPHPRVGFALRTRYDEARTAKELRNVSMTVRQISVECTERRTFPERGFDPCAPQVPWARRTASRPASLQNSPSEG